jgi:uncharacterized protein (DUF2267 family)
MHLISGLPMLIKAFYINNWKVSKERKREDTTEEFYDAIRDQSRRLAGRDFGDNAETKKAVQAVFRTVKQYIGEGEVKDIQSQLPPALAELWEV